MEDECESQAQASEEEDKSSETREGNILAAAQSLGKLMRRFMSSGSAALY